MPEQQLHQRQVAGARRVLQQLHLVGLGEADGDGGQCGRAAGRADADHLLGAGRGPAAWRKGVGEGGQAGQAAACCAHGPVAAGAGIGPAAATAVLPVPRSSKKQGPHEPQLALGVKGLGEEGAGGQLAEARGHRHASMRGVGGGLSVGTHVVQVAHTIMIHRIGASSGVLMRCMPPVGHVCGVCHQYGAGMWCAASVVACCM